MRVLGISGSLRRDSYNTKLLRHAGELFASEGVEFEIYEGLKDVPPATNAMRNKPVALIGASAGMFGAAWAQAELRKVLGAMGARVAEGEVAVGRAMDRFDANGAA
jgi:chromate reductase, NAD(P)H dehydrogenase (quinone)